MSAYTEIICPYTTRQTQYEKYSPDPLTSPNGSYFPSLSLVTGIYGHKQHNLVSSKDVTPSETRPEQCQSP
jgi:hypothetical protein